MQNYLFVAFGAALGGVGRYWVANVVQTHLPPHFPYGTLAVNILGSFLVGVVLFAVETGLAVRPSIRMVFAVGFCGALTTFSTFSYETMKLLQDAEYLLAGLNVVLNLSLTIAGLVLAFGVVNKVTGG